jgi:hypothetical protein
VGREARARAATRAESRRLTPIVVLEQRITDAVTAYRRRALEQPGDPVTIYLHREIGHTVRALLQYPPP